MRQFVISTVLVIGLGTAACVDNEISFFIEHAKTQPEAPACTWSPSDDFSTTGLIDLAFSSSYPQGFLVQNQLMSREDYDNLIAETNGIFVEGYEVSVRLASTNEAIGGTEAADVEIYVEPESVGIIPVIVLSDSVVDDLADAVGCLPLNSRNYPDETVYSSGTDINGEWISRDLGFANAQVRFLGHTNGGLDVETPEFTFGIYLCCGCLVNWNNCSDRCQRYCGEPDENKMCTLGVANGESQFDCRNLYSDPNAVWDDLSNENCVETNELGEEVPRSCTCADCAG